MTTPAGWYDDPQDSNTQRYWDGQSWTPHRERKATTPTTHQPAPAAGPPPAPGTTPSDQLGAYVGKVRPHVAKGQQFWSDLPRQRKIIFAAVGLAATVIVFAFGAHLLRSGESAYAGKSDLAVACDKIKTNPTQAGLEDASNYLLSKNGNDSGKAASALIDAITHHCSQYTTLLQQSGDTSDDSSGGTSLPPFFDPHCMGGNKC